MPASSTGTGCQNQKQLSFLDAIASLDFGYEQGLVKGAELCLNPYFFGWQKKRVGWL